jgi:hypothetical protein
MFPWLVVGAVVAGAVWVAVNAVGGDESQPEPEVVASPTETAEGLPEPVITPSPSEEPTPEGDEPVDFEGVTAQVLNATGGVEGAGQDMADRLARLGFDIIAIDTALGEIDVTTIYWTSSSGRPVAEALASDNGWIAAKKPDNLSSSVEIHVLVGKDEV